MVMMEGQARSWACRSSSRSASSSRAISLAFAGAAVSEIASIVLIQNPDHRGVRILSARDWKGT